MFFKKIYGKNIREIYKLTPCQDVFDSAPITLLLTRYARRRAEREKRDEEEKKKKELEEKRLDEERQRRKWAILLYINIYIY